MCGRRVLRASLLAAIAGLLFVSIGAVASTGSFTHLHFGLEA